MTSRELLAGPIVATIFVLRIQPIKQVRRENSSRNVLLSVEVQATNHRRGPLLVRQSGQYRSLERQVTKKSQISPLTRERTVSLFAGPRVFAVAAAELSALVAKKVDLAFRNRAQWPGWPF